MSTKKPPKKQPVKVSEADKAKAIQRIAAGESKEAVAESLKVHTSTLDYWRRKAAGTLPTSSRRKANGHGSPEDSAAAAKLAHKQVAAFFDDVRAGKITERNYSDTHVYALMLERTLSGGMR